ncbi:MAG: hypothetical protein WCJ51_03380 [Candidatus Moraniibacteriota bacterium]
MKIKYFFWGICFLLLSTFFSQSVFAATGGTCSGAGSSVLGNCRKTCVSATEKADGICKAGSGAAYVGQSCCVPVSATNTTATGAVAFTNPLTYDNLVDIATHIMVLVQRSIVTFALLAITIAAVMYVLSAGDPKKIEKAKETISAALIGLALAIAAPSILKELTGALGWASNNGDLAKAASLSAITVRLLNFLLGSFGILSLIMMITGAILYLTSAGDEERIKKGKDIFKFSVLGIVIAMSAMILVRQIAVFFAATPGTSTAISATNGVDSGEL